MGLGVKARPRISADPLACFVSLVGGRWQPRDGARSERGLSAELGAGHERCRRAVIEQIRSVNERMRPATGRGSARNPSELGDSNELVSCGLASHFIRRAKR